MHDLKSLAESHTLAYYNIDKESTLVLTNTSTICPFVPPLPWPRRDRHHESRSGSITFHVHYRETEVHLATLKMPAWATILDVKTQIAKQAAKLFVARKLPPEKQLLYAGRYFFLPDDNGSLSQWKIQNGDVLMVEISLPASKPPVTASQPPAIAASSCSSRGPQGN